MKRTSLLFNIVAIVVLSAILVGATFAWFTDTAISGGNKIQAGNLKIDLELLDKAQGWISLKDSSAPIFDCDTWEPGYTDVKILKIENEGSLALQWKAKFTSPTKLSALAEVIDVYVLPSDTEPVYPTERTLDAYIPVGTVADFVNTIESTTTGTLLAEDFAYLTIVLKMRSDVGNEYQGLSIGGAFDILILATQLSAENDGIDADYDSGAQYPVAAHDAQSLKDAMLQHNALITLADDIVVDASTPAMYSNYMFLANGRNVTIDLNGHDIIFDETGSKSVLYLFTTANKGTLNIIGEGSIITQNKFTGIFWGMHTGGQINVYGGTYISNVSEGGNNANHLMYASSGNIDVYGGKFYYPEPEWCANAQDSQGNRLCIVFHEGVLLQQSEFRKGDASRIQLAENCELRPVEIDGETWYQVCSIN